MDILHGSSPLPIHVNRSFGWDQFAHLVRHRAEQLARLGPCTSPLNQVRLWREYYSLPNPSLDSTVVEVISSSCLFTIFADRYC
jgi:hypothetical protein